MYIHSTPSLSSYSEDSMGVFQYGSKKCLSVRVKVPITKRQDEMQSHDTHAAHAHVQIMSLQVSK